MKKSILLLVVLTLTWACSEEEVYQELDGEVGQVTGIVTEEAISGDQVFEVVEEQPRFPGGQEAWVKFQKENLKYPEKAKNMGVEGAVYLSYVVSKEGAISDIQVTRGIGAGCDVEAVQLLQNSPNWTPGLQRGRPVNTRMAVRIVFKLNDSKKIAPARDKALASDFEEVVER